MNLKLNTMDYKNATQEQYDIRLKHMEFNKLLYAANTSEYYENRFRECQRANEKLTAQNNYMRTALEELRALRRKYERVIPIKDLKHYEKLEKDNARLRLRLAELRNNCLKV